MREGGDVLRRYAGEAILDAVQVFQEKRSFRARSA
jgi:hypothetical protein